MENIKCTYYSSLTHLPIYTNLLYTIRSHMLPSWNTHEILCMNMIKKIALANIKETRTAAAYVDINKNLGREFSYNVLS